MALITPSLRCEIKEQNLTPFLSRNNWQANRLSSPSDAINAVSATLLLFISRVGKKISGPRLVHDRLVIILFISELTC
jgi:hypothetical protein